MPYRPPTSVYVHFPWCELKCPYCDFAVLQVKEETGIPQAAYADALLRELELQRDGLKGRKLISVFFGGGTPSLFDPDKLALVHRAIRSAFDAEDADLEVTLECNPGSALIDKLDGWLDAGITRFSLGVQSLDNAALAFLGRNHSAKEAQDAVARLVQTGRRVSADLIFGLPGQSLDCLSHDVDTLVTLGVRHLSAYALTIEQGTRFGALSRRGALPLATDDHVAEGYLAIEKRLKARGFSHYEVSNYALSGEALSGETLSGETSVHNAHYWRGGDYLGLGLAAVGKQSSAPAEALRRRSARNIRRYLRARSSSDFQQDHERLGPDELWTEALMLGLRTSEGLDLRATTARLGSAWLDARRPSFERALSRGQLTERDGNLSIPQSQWLTLDSIVASVV